ncbi:P-loop containing nucleoside triphosphate hydrolase protein [Tribonema minus]|uniref:RNA helicase n=1 Tax=Tribonema minus TaxID=303371 RepID=A0A835YJ27_9STRA|nr:P-loop containing nucleoside triphosphate hydrolase protein [Tribonema minus]
MDVADTLAEQEAEAKAAAEMPVTCFKSYRTEHGITVSGFDAAGKAPYEAPNPVISFGAAPFHPSIKTALKAAGFAAPTPTQAQSWPVVLQGRDLISVAKTGSGKTLGFLLPAFHRMQEKKTQYFKGKGPSILVLAPTRELACQIYDESRKFGRLADIKSCCLYGGAPKWPQIQALATDPQVVIATPGRLNDIANMRKISLANVEFLVLDEADRMLDMGFEPQIREILGNMGPKTSRQTLFFTATWPKTVQKLAREFLSNPVQLNLGSGDSLQANKSISQTIAVIGEGDKEDALKELLASRSTVDKEGVMEHGKIIIFTARKRTCDELSRRLWNGGFSVDALHGDKEQRERTSVMTKFKAGSIRMVVATDVAARGLDVKDIALVINYDFPTGGVEDYVHRIGRTARGGATGEAHTFFTRGDSKYAKELIRVLQGANQTVPPELEAMGGRGGGGGFGGGGRGGGNRRFGGSGGGRGRGGGGGGFRKKW